MTDTDLLEYSVVFTDRSVNHMSKRFQACMNELHEGLTETYKAASMVLVPGGGSYAMEAVARQFGMGKRKTFLRNGWFSYRWTQIFDAIEPGYQAPVLMAQRVGEGPTAPFAPKPLAEVLEHIETYRPDVFFAPHVETSAGMVLPDDYIQSVGAAVRANGGVFVLDCVASGSLWIDMEALNVDVLVTAPQKGWSSTPSSGVVLLGERAVERLGEASAPSSFVLDLARWHGIMKAYLDGGHAYHATMPTDSLLSFAANMRETLEFGLDNCRAAQIQIGKDIRGVLEEQGFQSVAAEGYQAAPVVVSFAPSPDYQTGAIFAAKGLQIAAGVPLAIEEGPDYKSFRFGLFGLDKLRNPTRTVTRLQEAMGW